MALEVETKERYRRQLQEVLASRLFSDAPVQRKLLSYLAEKAFEGTSDELKEYSIGVELFQKSEAYSPQTDPSVRVQTNRLRGRLEEFFKTEGAESDTVVRLPKGNFTLVFEPRNPQAEAAAVAVEESGPGRPWLRYIVTAVVVLLVAIAIYQQIALRHLQQEITSVQLDPGVARLWKPLINSPRPLVLVIGMPLWVRLKGGYYRDSDVNSPEEIPAASSLNKIFEQAGQKPEHFEYGFNGLGETLQAFLLGRMFLAAHKPVTVARSNTLSWEELRSQDAVLLGSSKSNPHLRDMSFLVNYRMVPGGIQVLHPAKGEPAYYKPTINAQRDTTADYAIVARLPGIGGNGYIMVLGAESTSGNWAAAELMTDPHQAGQVVARLAGTSGQVPEFFEMILHAEFRSMVPVKIDYVTHRVIQRRTVYP